MPNICLKFAALLTGDEAQIRVRDVVATTNYDITLAANTYMFGDALTGTAVNIITALNTAINTALGTALTFVSLHASGRRISWNDQAGAYTLRTLPCDEDDPVALMLGLYGVDYATGTYQAADAPATWRVTVSGVWFESGVLHPEYDGDGFPEWVTQHRVSEGGESVHLSRGRRSWLNLTLPTVPGATVRGAWYDGDYGATDTDSVSLWRAYDPEMWEPLVLVEIGTWIDDFYYLQEPISPESVTPDVDRWNGYYTVRMRLVAA